MKNAKIAVKTDSNNFNYDILISFPSIQNKTSAMIANIYGVFIDARHIIFFAVLETVFFQNTPMVQL